MIMASVRRVADHQVRIPAGRGRPRRPGVDESVARAVRELVAEVGYQGTTMDLIARRAGVGKAALYRRWRSKAELIFAAVVDDGNLLAPPATGALATDLALLIGEVIRRITAPGAHAALTGLRADLELDHELRDRFYREVLGNQRAVIAEVIDRAVVSGELPRHPDAGLAHALLVGPLYARAEILGDPIGREGEAIGRAYLAAVVAAIRALSTAGPV